MNIIVATRIKELMRENNLTQVKLADKIGLKPSVKIALMNGALECEYRKYEIFDGRYKEFKGEGRNLDKRRESSRRASSPFDKKKRYDNSRNDSPNRFERPGKPASHAENNPTKPKPFGSHDRFKPEGERSRWIHGEEAFQKFVTFKQPSLKPDDNMTNRRKKDTDNQE